MPQDIEELLFQMDNPDEITRIQKKWAEYNEANKNYERNYDIQFANLVEANLKFKESKTIPTPAEQMRNYTDAIRAEISDLIEERQKEPLYELEENIQEPEQASRLADDIKAKFKLSFDYRDNEKSNGQDLDNKGVKKGHTLDKSQELGLSWLKSYQKQKAQETNRVEPDLDKPSKFKIVFDHNKDNDKQDVVDLGRGDFKKEDLDIDLDLER